MPSCFVVLMSIQGCDGDRLYYDGCSSIIVNGEIVAQASQFSLKDVEVVTATVDLDEVRSARFAPSRRAQASKTPAYERVVVDMSLCYDFVDQPTDLQPSRPRSINFHCPEEEISLGPACWYDNC